MNLGPALLMLGLKTTTASTASLLLNLESVLTALIVWLVFKGNVDNLIFLGMLFITCAGVLLSWDHVTWRHVEGTLPSIAPTRLCWSVQHVLLKTR